MLTSRRTALGAMLALAAVTLTAAVRPAPAAAWGRLFWPLGGLLALSLGASLWRRRGALRSWSAAGGWVMHGGLLLVVLAGGWNAASARTDGVEVIEGQTVAVAGTGAAVTLLKVYPAYHEGAWAKGDAAEVSVIEHGRETRRELVRVNRPLRLGATWLHLGLHGYAPLLRVTREGVGPAEDPATFVSLETTLTPVVRYWRRLREIPGAGRGATMVFRPSPAGPYPRDPRLILVLDGPDGKPVTAALAPGRPATAGGCRFELGEVRRWSRFAIAREPGLDLLFAGAWIAVAGAAAMVLGGFRRGRG